MRRRLMACPRHCKVPCMLTSASPLPRVILNAFLMLFVVMCIYSVPRVYSYVTCSCVTCTRMYGLRSFNCVPTIGVWTGADDNDDWTCHRLASYRHLNRRESSTCGKCEHVTFRRETIIRVATVSPKPHPNLSFPPNPARRLHHDASRRRCHRLPHHDHRWCLSRLVHRQSRHRTGW